MQLSGDGFIIKTVFENNLDDILNVYRQCEDFLTLGPNPKASAEMVLNDIESADNNMRSYCGIFRDDAMIGVVDFSPANHGGMSGAAYIALLMIAENFRNQGIGEAVLKRLEKDILENSGIQVIRAGVQTNNHKAISFWQRMGYSITGEPMNLEDGTNCFELEKRVTLR